MKRLSLSKIPAFIAGAISDASKAATAIAVASYGAWESPGPNKFVAVGAGMVLGVIVVSIFKKKG